MPSAEAAKPALTSLPIAQLIDAISKGLPYRHVREFQRHSGLSLDQIAEAISIPRRTLQRRQETGRLRPDESDRLVRLARAFAAAVELFHDDTAAARRWFTHPVRGLGGKTPLEYVRTSVGAREVEDLVGRLMHGVFT